MTPKERREEAAKRPGHLAGTNEFSQTFNVLYDEEEAKLGRRLTPPERGRMLGKARQQSATSNALRPEESDHRPALRGRLPVSRRRLVSGWARSQGLRLLHGGVQGVLR